jgi:hypothetical protein
MLAYTSKTILHSLHSHPVNILVVQQAHRFQAMQAEEYVLYRRITILPHQWKEAAEPEYLHCLKPFPVSGKPSSMQQSFLTATFLLATFFCLTSCGLDCVDKKTGMHKSSQTLKEAKEKDLFVFEFAADKSSFNLDSGLLFKIKNAWVENSWKYECIDNEARVVKDSSLQFVIDADYHGDAINSKYWLGNNHLGAVLRFGYSGHDTITLTLFKDTSFTLTNNGQTVDKITFVKRQVSRGSGLAKCGLTNNVLQL